MLKLKFIVFILVASKSHRDKPISLVSSLLRNPQERWLVLRSFLWSREGAETHFAGNILLQLKILLIPDSPVAKEFRTSLGATPWVGGFSQAGFQHNWGLLAAVFVFLCLVYSGDSDWWWVLLAVIILHVLVLAYLFGACSQWRHLFRGCLPVKLDSLPLLLFARRIFGLVLLAYLAESRWALIEACSLKLWIKIIFIIFFARHVSALWVKGDFIEFFLSVK
jgi:hypothetical protein